MSNCPNCGAPIHGGICEYCGTVFPKYVEKVEEFKKELVRLRVESSNAEQSAYLLSVLGKWVAG